MGPARTPSLLVACMLLGGASSGCLGSLDYLGDSSASGSGGGGCATGGCEPVLVADGQDGPFGVAVDATHVYWTNEGSRTVVRAPKDGGDAEQIAASIDGGVVFKPTFLVVGATQAVWMNAESGTLNDGKALVAATKDGGPAGGFAESSPDGNTGLAADGDRYWFGNFYTDAIRVAELGQPYTDFAGDQSFPSQVAVDGTHVYWTRSESDSGAVMRAPRDGSSAAENLAPGIATANGIALDADAVYVTSGAGVFRVPKEGGDALPIASGQFGPSGIVVAGDRVYWVNAGDGGSGALMRVDTMGQEQPETVADGQADPRLVAADETQVYWTNNGDGPGTGSVMRVAR